MLDMATKKPKSKKSATRKRERSPSVAEQYSIAADAAESDLSDGKNLARGRTLAAKIWLKHPFKLVPHRVRDLIEFNEQEAMEELAKAEGAETPDEVADTISGYDVVEADDDHVEIEGRTSKRRWIVWRNEELAEAHARTVVVESLTSEPDMWSQKFLQRHIDKVKLSNYVYQSRMEDDYVNELAAHQTRDFWRLATQLNVELPDEKGGEAINDYRDADRLLDPDDYMDAVKEAYAQDAAQDPMQFFRDIYGNNEAEKYAIEAVGFDLEAAADDAIQTDGWVHFVNSYDGKDWLTPYMGYTYYRVD